MEAIGRLAGGIAHDFDNLLTVISGYGSIQLERTSSSDPLHDEAEQIKAAADRAAALTRQLLAFSRQQVLQPRGRAMSGFQCPRRLRGAAPRRHEGWPLRNARCERQRRRDRARNADAYFRAILHYERA
jgi:signal transduction histidine kinase